MPAEPARVAPILVFGYGNPSRGDDALGYLLVERLGARLAGTAHARHVDLLTDFQLQVEHALDLAGREQVIFADASVRATAPFEFVRVEPAADGSFTTHALSPHALLHAYVRAVGSDPPESWLLAIRGDGFELGEPVSEAAAGNLDAALEFLARRLGA